MKKLLLIFLLLSGCTSFHAQVQNKNTLYNLSESEAFSLMETVINNSVLNGEFDKYSEFAEIFSVFIGDVKGVYSFEKRNEGIEITFSIIGENVPVWESANFDKFNDLYLKLHEMFKQKSEEKNLSNKLFQPTAYAAG